MFLLLAVPALAQYAVTTKAQNIVSLSEQHRTATLVSFGDFRKINCPSMMYYAVTREFPPDCLIIFKISYAFLVLGLRGATHRVDPLLLGGQDLRTYLPGSL